MNANPKEYRTDNLALCPYLQLNGLKYLRPELSVGKNDKPVVVFIFEDPLEVGRELELDFTKSQFKQYRDIFFFFRGEIERLKRQVEYLNRKNQQKNDEKHIDEFKDEVNNG